MINVEFIEEHWPLTAVKWGTGLTVADIGSQFAVSVPDVYRVGHESHFAQVTLQFLQYMQDRGLLPGWEIRRFVQRDRLVVDHQASPCSAEGEYDLSFPEVV